MGHKWCHMRYAAQLAPPAPVTLVSRIRPEAHTQLAPPALVSLTGHGVRPEAHSEHFSAVGL